MGYWSGCYWWPSGKSISSWWVRRIMLAIEMLPGGHGDALVVEYGTSADTHRILIDGGTARSWDAVRERLKARPDQTYEAMVITHVDEDHIGGSLQILADPDLRHRIRDIWF